MKKETIKSWIVDVMRETECICGKKFCFQKDEEIVYCHYCDRIYRVDKNAMLKFAGYRCFDEACKDVPYEKIYYHSTVMNTTGLPYCEKHFIRRQKELEYYINSQKEKIKEAESVYIENNLKVR